MKQVVGRGADTQVYTSEILVGKGEGKLNDGMQICFFLRLQTKLFI